MSDPVTLAILGLAFISGLTTLLGVVLAFLIGHKPKVIATGMGFSAGIMLLIASFELIPEAIRLTGIIKTIAALAIGGLVLAFLNWLLPHTHLLEEKGVLGARMKRTAYLVALGLILHDFPEGFGLANAYIVSWTLGIQLALAIAAHNIPEGFAMAVPAVALKRRRFLFTVALASSLAEPSGAALGLIAVHVRPDTTPLFMAFAAGAMIFVSIHELLPMAATYGKSAFLALGVLLSAAVYTGLIIVFPD